MTGRTKGLGGGGQVDAPDSMCAGSIPPTFSSFRLPKPVWMGHLGFPRAKETGKEIGRVSAGVRLGEQSHILDLVQQRPSWSP